MTLTARLYLELRKKANGTILQQKRDVQMSLIQAQEMDYKGQCQGGKTMWTKAYWEAHNARTPMMMPFQYVPIGPFLTPKMNLTSAQDADHNSQCSVGGKIMWTKAYWEAQKAQTLSMIPFECVA